VWGVVSGSIAGEASVMVGVVRTSSSEFGVLGEARTGECICTAASRRLSARYFLAKGGFRVRCDDDTRRSFLAGLYIVRSLS
jgi:hypothetical protein